MLAHYGKRSIFAPNRPYCPRKTVRRLEDIMTRKEIEDCWQDPSNYKWGAIYYCKADPRPIVPKRYKWMGWTVNFARPSAIPWVGLALAILAIPAWIVIAKGAATSIVLVTEVAAIAVVFLLSAWLSSRTE
ncbi:MAG TPA: DUF5808 domain-containing protein [Verrucomicrobiae bacterium]|jgi:hypothetical protein|nr:DUF5808 domain-containing protein [Verrucomicrobiae bacterium]